MNKMQIHLKKSQNNINENIIKMKKIRRVG